MLKVAGRPDLKQSQYCWVLCGGESPWVSDAETREAQTREKLSLGVTEQEHGRGGVGQCRVGSAVPSGTLPGRWDCARLGHGAEGSNSRCRELVTHSTHKHWNSEVGREHVGFGPQGLAVVFETFW